MKKLLVVVNYILLAFIFISIGFSLGKHSAKMETVEAEVGFNSGKSEIVVYYMHATFRCVTCNTIESMTKDLLDKSYQDEVTSGKITWKEVNFQDNEALADKFEVAASCVVVARMQDGRIVDFQRLDEVWTLMEKPADFNNYISTAIDKYLPGTES